jgi:hypothetical protein
MYMSVRDIDFAPFYDCSVGFWISLLSSFRRYYHHQICKFLRYYHRSFALLSSSLFFQRRFSVHKNSMQDKITHDHICC